MERILLKLKYTFDCMPKDLYLALTQPTYLQNWIAEKVDFDDRTQVYTFWWGNSQESARIVETVRNHFIKWKWTGHDKAENEYVSFRIEALAGDKLIDLYIEDFCDANEEKSLSEGWESQMHRLETLLG